MFNGDLEDVLNEEEIKELLAQDVDETRYDLDLYDASDDFADVEFTAEELAAIDAVEERPTQSDSTLRKRLVEATEEATGHSPYPWQLDIACIIHKQKQDILVIAGTGYGKTLPFVMNCFLRRDMIVWVVSPLNYIEIEQAKVFTDWGLKAVAVNSATSHPNLAKDLKDGKFQVVISSIENFTASNKLRPIIASMKFSNRPQLLVVDEAHVLSKWTETGFRPAYASTGELRRLLPPNTPVLAATATANKRVRAQITGILDFRDKPYELTLGNHRSNIIQSIHWLKGAESAVKEINQYISKTEPTETLIYVDSRDLGYTILETLREHVDPSVRGQIQLYHARMTDFRKRIIEEGFKRGTFKVIICTEALTMGADFRNVRLVINFLTPDSAQTWAQRSGRGARDKSIVCHAIIMAQPSTRRGHKSCKLGPGIEQSSQPQRTTHNGTAADENREQEASAEVGPEANAENAAGAGNFGVVEDAVDGVDEDTAANADADADADADEGEGDGQEDDAEGVIENEDNMLQPVVEASSKSCRHTKKGHKEADQSSKEANKKKQGRTHTRTILEFINHTGCLTKFLDTEYDNPLRSDETRCTTCKNCLDREQAANPQAETQPIELQPAATPKHTQAPAPGAKITWLRPAARKECEEELRKWRRTKWESPECANLDMRETHLMSDKCLVSIARHPSINSVADLDTTSLLWAHRRRWGEEIVSIMQAVQENRRIVKDLDSYRSIVNTGIKNFWKARRAAEEKAIKAAERARKQAEVQRNKNVKAEAQARRRVRVEQKESGKEREQGEEGEIRVKEEVKEEGVLEASGSKGKTRVGRNRKVKQEGLPDAKSRWELLDEYTVRLNKPSTSRSSQNPLNYVQ